MKIFYLLLVSCFTFSSTLIAQPEGTTAHKLLTQQVDLDGHLFSNSSEKRLKSFKMMNSVNETIIDSLSFTYNPQGQISQIFVFHINQYPGSLVLNSVIRLEYNTNHQIKRKLTLVKDYYTNQLGVFRDFSYEYNEYHKLIKEIDNDYEIRYEYNDHQQVTTKKKFYRGFLEEFETYHYDSENNRLIEFKHYQWGDASNPFQFTLGYNQTKKVLYHYDEKGLLLQEDLFLNPPGTYGPPPTMTFSKKVYEYTNEGFTNIAFYNIDLFNNETYIDSWVTSTDSEGYLEREGKWVQGPNWMESVTAYLYEYESKEVTAPSKNEMIVYPNPADQQLHISFYEDGLKGNANYQLYLLNGQSVREGNIELSDGKNLHSIAVDDLPNGVYLLHFNIYGTRYSKKVIIKH